MKLVALILVWAVCLFLLLVAATLVWQIYFTVGPVWFFGTLIAVAWVGLGITTHNHRRNG